MSEEDLVNNKTYISDFDITKHIVLDNESNYWYSAEYVDKMLKKQDKEIERLKELCDKYEEEHKTTFEEWKKTINIINELEKYIIDFKEDYEKNEFQPNAKVYIYWKDLIDKLQELKGSDK